MQTDIIKIGPSQNASPKLCPATDSLTGVKCRATSVAKNWGQRRKLQFQILPAEYFVSHLQISNILSATVPSTS